MVDRKGTIIVGLLLAIANGSTLAADNQRGLAGAVDCLDAPALPVPTGNIVRVDSESQLQQAVRDAQANTTIVIADGVYVLTNTLNVRRDNVTIRGEGHRCDEVVLVGRGMEEPDYGNVPHGIFTEVANLTVQNLTIRDVYFHPIQLSSGADSPHLYNLRLLNAGEQFVKANSGGFGLGVDNGIVEYTIMEYTDSPPDTDHGGGTGYTNGVDVHGGENWRISNNLFKNFHTPDDADFLWNPAVLMWNGAQGTITENNTFIDVDRAIAYGLGPRTTGTDHFAGIIRNNMIYTTPNLLSDSRRANSDGLIIVWDSPQTKVLHNTIMSNDNQRLAVEFRFDSTGSEALNNLSDAPMSARSGATFDAAGNLLEASASMFVNPSIGDLHLNSTAVEAIDQVGLLADASMDFDGGIRSSEPASVDIGADELNVAISWIFFDGFE